ncbi:B3 domain-containing protein Os07g0679700-like isoform X2 [Macadamia integrifolia]|uniref:B3 domain-containing protein Os07g0679700-like isoform X2 n=1 Tax=Macadamia integrifolia TaxID=60698 RepID=UPI001C4FDDCE|nr:B3 domain-containing protein Os07g0679700-like isoform X2 [Macadamia integrifolia]XP_042508614.1 B3 domain-containing protein Os07g0679700-like isoform X2 [Macadamia integrifolia]
MEHVGRHLRSSGGKGGVYDLVDLRISAIIAAFHSKESGWRECNSCGKRLHCGCVASKDALVILDNGGVECLHCARTSGLSFIPRDERPYKFGTSAADNVGELPSISVDNTVDGDGCHILPKPLKMGSSTGLEGNKDILPHIRVARPPAEGRVRSQLLPRYWPKITDQELQQISGDSNSTIVPLFEKVLSASDAGRIGRLVLPKACAEAYFPPISQPEGLQLKIQDVKGKDWVFQFRFWPNNNSRMYVLEGVTPCIQSMQLQAGDTVTFSRIYPEGKLVMGFRKASNSIPMQGSTDPHLSALSEHLSSADVDIGSHKNESLQLQPTLDPPPIVKPSIMVEDQEFEEYKEPPVVGKRTIFTARSSGEQDQWARCDGCSKWRRLPVDALLPPKWTCAENSWDPRWSSCSAPSEMSPKELENLLRLNMGIRQPLLSFMCFHTKIKRIGFHST